MKFPTFVSLRAFLAKQSCAFPRKLLRRFTPHIVFAALLGLSACNLPMTQGVAETTPTVLKVRVSVATEYRAGPGQVYDLVGTLDPGQEVEAFGRSPDGDYLLIRDPTRPAVMGWLKSGQTTLTGDPVGLPISNPPPTPTLVGASVLGGGCPTPIGGGPTPVSCPEMGGAPAPSGGCPTPIGGGPTPVSCPEMGGAPASGGGCPTPIGGGPTPVSCPEMGGAPAPSGGCPTPVGGGPTPVSCPEIGGAPALTGGCPTPIGGGPTPVSCTSGGGAPAPSGGCPTPVGGGPTPVSCTSGGGAPPLTGGCPTPIGGGPTPVSCSSGGGTTPDNGLPPIDFIIPVRPPKSVPGPTPISTPVK